MKLDIYYRNNKNEKIYLDRKPYMMLASTDLFDYDWDYTVAGTLVPRVTKLSNNMKKKTFTIIIEGEDKNSTNEKLNKFLNVVEYDTTNLVPGRLYVGECYLTCYVIGSKKSAHYGNSNKVSIEITLLAISTFWTKEIRTTLGYIQDEEEDEPAPDYGLDYPYDYPYDFTPGGYVKTLINKGTKPCDFEIIITGPCEKPMLVIFDSYYQVNADLEKGESFVINSKEKSLLKVSVTGSRTNMFNARNKDYNIFKPIPIGSTVVFLNGNFTCTITQFQERNEPEWI